MNNVYIRVTSPNQKVVVTKKTLSDAEHTYSRVNVEAVLTAERVLSDKAYKLYMRMNLHQENYTYALSPTAIKKEIGMSESKYRSAVKELVLKGYLVLDQGMKNVYSFYEYPQKDCNDSVASKSSESTENQIANEEEYTASEVVPVADEEEYTASPMDSAIEEANSIDSADQVADIEASSAENEEMNSQIRPDDNADSNGEIYQDITGDTPEDIPFNTESYFNEDLMPSPPYSYEQAWQMLMEKEKQETQLELDRQHYRDLISCVDPDDICFYDHLNPDWNLSPKRLDYTTGFDDSEMPF